MGPERAGREWPDVFRVKEPKKVDKGLGAFVKRGWHRRLALSPSLAMQEGDRAFLLPRKFDGK